jgi:hypothetical protein
VTALWLRTIRCLVAFTLGLLIVPLCAEAQQPAQKLYRLGVLSAVPASRVDPRHEAFLQGLRELGYVEGKNLLWSTAMRRASPSASLPWRRT